MTDDQIVGQSAEQIAEAGTAPADGDRSDRSPNRPASPRTTAGSAMSETRDLRLDRAVVVRVVVPVVVAIVPLVVAAVRAAAGSWVPFGDDAYFTARSLDVGTAHHPLLGAWSSGSVEVGETVNNLGPLQLDLLAPFTRVAPWGGTAIGVVTVHVAAIITIAWLVTRMVGRRYVLPAMAAVSVLTWQLGSEKLITPQQHQYLLIAYLCVLVGAWAVATGDRWALVPVVFFGSLVTQTHLSYPILVAALAVPMLVGQVTDQRRRQSSPDAVPRSVRPIVIAGALTVVLWLHTAIEQIWVGGNFAKLFRAGGDGPTPGWVDSLRLVADVVTSPTGYLRPGYAEYDPNYSSPGNVQITLLGVAWVSMTVGAIVAYRRRHDVAAAGLAVASTSVVASVVNTASLPVSSTFGLLFGTYRWLWPTAVFLLLGALCGVMRLANGRDRRIGHVATGLVASILILAFLANLPTSLQVRDPDEYRQMATSTQEMVEQLRDVDFEGPVVVDDSNMYFGHPYIYATLTLLQRQGVDFRFDDPLHTFRFGDERASDGSARQRLVLWFGEAAVVRRDSANTVGYVDGLPPAAASLVEIP